MTSGDVKKLLFVTGTRADFGKLKPLVSACQSIESFQVQIFATGMHLSKKYGFTIDEIYKSGFNNIYPFINHDASDAMDRSLANTINGLSYYLSNNTQDLIIVHGDRLEALAGAIVGAFNNVLVAHIEGGEISGTIDESIRHSVSKLSHIHLVANNNAFKRLIQMGEAEDSIHVIGSPDVDVMIDKNLPSLATCKEHYNINFENYGILMFHPVTTELNLLEQRVKLLLSACIKSKKNFIVIYPNNDPGSDTIMKSYQILEGNPKFTLFPSLRFEMFLTLLKNSDFIIGNSSAGIREAPYYGIQTINIGSRQNGRCNYKTINNCDFEIDSILAALNDLSKYTPFKFSDFGDGNSANMFAQLLQDRRIWQISKQKAFLDIY